MYLRNEYATITEYNEQAGSVAEKYHFLVVADFPAGFSETAAKRLQSIAASGPRCGVFTLIHWDQRQPLPDGFVPDELRKSSVCIRARGRARSSLDTAQRRAGATLVLRSAAGARISPSRSCTRSARRASTRTASKCPSRRSRPRRTSCWTSDTTNELRDRRSAAPARRSMQYLAIGKGTRQHALFAGKTGSGKSTLFHVIITNLALACSPGAGRVLPHRFQERRGVQVLRHEAAAACARRRHRERPRVCAQRAPARG